MNPVERETRLLDAISILTDTLAADYDVIDVLQTLLDTCSLVLDVDEGGVLLADPQTGVLDVVASTNESSRIVEAMQLSAVSGPCIDAYHDSRIVSVPDIAALPNRSARFRASALEEGFRSVYAIPMRSRSTTIGAVNFFRAQPGELNEVDRRAAEALTTMATVGILNERSSRASEVVQHQLQDALDSRVVIEQAKGVLAHTLDLSMDEAFLRIRRFARREQTGLAVVARRIVERTLLL